jgi:N-acetyl-anhydromuramyl-L-alanine amidase AmpD
MKPSIIIQNDPEEKIKLLLNKAIDVERWAPKTNNTYSFLEDEEREEMVDSILLQLDKEGYEIKRKK